MTPAPFSIRRVLAADLPAYKALRDAMLATHPTAFTSDADTERRRTSDSYLNRLGLEDAGGAVFTLGAWRGDALAGAISLEHDARIKVRHTAHITGMMVLDTAQGLGIGRALLVDCITRARESRDLTMLTLSVTADNASAIRLYTSTGFVRYGSLPNAVRVDDRWHAKDLMVLAL